MPQSFSRPGIALATKYRFMRPLIVFLVMTVGVACTTTEDPMQTMRPAEPQSMSGFWEIDFAKSDNLNQQLSSIARQVQREAARLARAAEDGRPFINSSLPNTNELVTLARLTEVITEPTLLEIYQDAAQIRVKRDNSFALSCDVLPGVVKLSETRDVVGIQRCGWDADQLLFELDLFEGLNITHRFSAAETGEELLLTTTVRTTTTPYPFRVNQYFTRYNPNDLGYRCQRTLTRGTVCTTEGDNR